MSTNDVARVRIERALLDWLPYSQEDADNDHEQVWGGTSYDDVAEAAPHLARFIAGCLSDPEPMGDRLKVALCNALIKINADDPGHPMIPPTAINWIGDALVHAALEAVTP